MKAHRDTIVNILAWSFTVFIAAICFNRAETGPSQATTGVILAIFSLCLTASIAYEVRRWRLARRSAAKAIA